MDEDVPVSLLTLFRSATMFTVSAQISVILVSKCAYSNSFMTLCLEKMYAMLLLHSFYNALPPVTKCVPSKDKC